MSDYTDPVQLNVEGVNQLVGSSLNKVNDGVFESEEGVESELFDALELPTSDEDLLTLRDKWEEQYMPYEGKISEKQKKNLTYYKGAQLEGSPYVMENPAAPNLQWEAAETFYAAALSKNPDPVVYGDNTLEGNELASVVKTMLQYHADYLDLRAHLTLQTRQWSVYLLGVKKWGWDKKTNEVCVSVRRIQDFIFDKNGFVDVKGHFTSYLGERITVIAEKLIEMFPKKEAQIRKLVSNKLGTECTFTEWWTDEYCFSSFDDIILDKHKNEFYNYPTKGKDDLGLPSEIPARNHFTIPIKPYTFLSVYSLGEQPHDITSLLEQNIPTQNKIIKRTSQIDRNLSHQNNFVAFSEDNFTQQTAKQALAGPEKGHGILVPQGVDIARAIVRFPAEGFPVEAFRELEIAKEDLRSSWGITGITATPPDENTTARGMILNQQRDNTRIGGGIGEAIERVAKADFNWLVQLYHVFYDEQHFAAIMGQQKAVEFVVLSNHDLTQKLIVSVAPDSMKPKDEVTVMNQALTLWQEGALDPQSLLTILNFPNPKETAEQAVLWKLAPQQYMQLNFPQLSQDIQKLMMMQNAQMAQPQATPGTPPSAAVPGVPGQGQPVAQPQAPAQGGIPPEAALNQVQLPQ